MRFFKEGIVCALMCSTAALAATHWFVPSVSTRQIEITRAYDLDLTAGVKHDVYLPGMMSFYGATNEQEILRCDFQYSVPPDAVRIASDDLEMPRKYYCLTWNHPPAEPIHVTQTMSVELRCRNRLYTKAPYPYDPAVLEPMEAYLGDGKNGKIIVSDPNLQPICEAIMTQDPETAEQAVQLVCDWINDNIEFGPCSASSRKVLAGQTGDCGGMAMLACAILRKMGIPSDLLIGKFFNRTSGYHGFMEVYFPDAGWVFYDLSNWQRGFEIPNCLLTAGRNYRIEAEGQPPRWVNGYFCRETDVKDYKKPTPVKGTPLRPGPATQEVMGVKVSDRDMPDNIRIRRRSLRDLMLDASEPPGVRQYVP